MKHLQRTAALLLFLCLLALTSCTPADGMAEDALLEIRFLDVGQGDAILLRTAEGDILIDTGPDDHEDLLCLRLRQLHVTRLRLMILTHPDEDHIGGADGVLYTLPVEEIWIPETGTDSESIRLMQTAAGKNGSEIRNVFAGEIRRYGDAEIVLFAPWKGGGAGSNDSSIICKVTCKEVSALFTGDAESGIEKELLRRYGEAQFSCNLYKVGHHGSSTSTSQEFLDAMHPSYAVISAEAGNSYGHPHGEVLDRLRRAGVCVWRTDLSGEIVFTTDGETLRYRK